MVCARDSNPRPHYGRRRRYHVAIAGRPIIGKFSNYSQRNCLLQFNADSQFSMNQPLA